MQISTLVLVFSLAETGGYAIRAILEMSNPFSQLIGKFENGFSSIFSSRMPYLKIEKMTRKKQFFVVMSE